MVVLLTVVSVWSPCTMTTGAVTFLTVWTLVVQAVPTSMSCLYTSNRNMGFGHMLCCYDNNNGHLHNHHTEAFCVCKNLMYEVLRKPKQVLFACSGVIIAIATETLSNSTDS